MYLNRYFVPLKFKKYYQTIDFIFFQFMDSLGEKSSQKMLQLSKAQLLTSTYSLLLRLWDTKLCFINCAKKCWSLAKRKWGKYIQWFYMNRKWQSNTMWLSVQYNLSALQISATLDKKDKNERLQEKLRRLKQGEKGVISQCRKVLMDSKMERRQENLSFCHCLELLLLDCRATIFTTHLHR